MLTQYTGNFNFVMLSLNNKSPVSTQPQGFLVFMLGGLWLQIFHLHGQTCFETIAISSFVSYLPRFQGGVSENRFTPKACYRTSENSALKGQVESQHRNLFVS